METNSPFEEQEQVSTSWLSLESSAAANDATELLQAGNECFNNSNDKMGGCGRLMS